MLVLIILIQKKVFYSFYNNNRAAKIISSAYYNLIIIIHCLSYYHIIFVSYLIAIYCETTNLFGEKYDKKVYQMIFLVLRTFAKTNTMSYLNF